MFIDSYSTGVVAIGYTFSPSKPYNAANINRWGITVVDKADYGAEVAAICNVGRRCKPSDNTACIGSVIFVSVHFTVP